MMTYNFSLTIINTIMLSIILFLLFYDYKEENEIHVKIPEEKPSNQHFDKPIIGRPRKPKFHDEEWELKREQEKD